MTHDLFSDIHCLVKSTNDLKFKHAAEAWFLILYNVLYLCTIMPTYGYKRVIRSCKSRNTQNTKKNHCWQTLHRKENQNLSNANFTQNRGDSVISSDPQLATVMVIMLNIRCWVIFGYKPWKRKKDGILTTTRAIYQRSSETQIFIDSEPVYNAVEVITSTLTVGTQ